MSKAMLKALKQEKANQDTKRYWYARNRCYDRSADDERRELSLALSSVPKVEWSYFDVKLRQHQEEDDRFCPLLDGRSWTPSGRALILLLEDTLTSSVELPDGCILVSKRPGLDDFLRDMAKQYELVLCTALQPDHARRVVKQALQCELSSGWFQLQNHGTIQALAVTATSSTTAGDSDHVIVVPKYLPDARHSDDGRLKLLAQVLLDLAKLSSDDWLWGLRHLKVQGVFRSIRNGEQQQRYNLNLGLGSSMSTASHNLALRVALGKPITPLPAGDGAYLPPAPDSGRPTLVLDLDETLVSSYRVSSSEDATLHRVAKRPGVEEFLASMANKCEVVLWTASWQAYADAVVDEVLDPAGSGIFSHRLYAQHLVSDSKDLSKLGRRLERVIAVDDSEWRYPASMRQNLLVVPAYMGGHGQEDEEHHLQRVAALITRLVSSGAIDLRPSLGRKW
ncbi:hypothetical protein SELMODRAFT_402603 [Selaginella moellendorffii]|uniref:Mitochondrial import inner membrane translocase subunit TIM50 n=1 Tax=Selaginella moellendorffii TaxID=88036 RepID=D8QR72_SELML|nr:hypothetical protein SELMODRAFT_402603 [Selaginella moellendorffii]